jgi:zinc transporter ZupT
MIGIYPILIFLVLLTLAGAAAGIKLAETPSVSQRVLPFSGGMLIGVAVFWILPEIAQHDVWLRRWVGGWLGAITGLAVGFTILWLIDHYIYPVCPTCSHTHDHGSCSERLHGFAVPLLIASGLHNFFDGWSLSVSQQKGFEDLKVGFLLGIGAHKLPEGLALGALLTAALGTARNAMLGAVAAQAMMVAGGVLAAVLAPHMGTSWTIGFLSVAAGAFVYLGYHAIDSEYQRRGVATSVMPALTGAVGAAALRSIVPGI